MKKTYVRPRLQEYGKIRDLTSGATGNSPDYNLVGGQWIANGNGVCTNFIPRGGCIKLS